MAKSEATVEELVAMIERGQLRLPEMQRRYVWQATRVRNLVDSLYRGYPSGAILVWETDEDVPLREFAVDQDPSPYQTTRLLLDGQQRLTSLSAVIRGRPVTVEGRRRPIELLFNLEHPDEVSFASEASDASATDEPIEDEADSTEDEIQKRVDRLTFVVGTRKLEQLPHWVKVSEVFATANDGPILQRAGITQLTDPRYEKYSTRLGRLRDIRKYTYRMDVLERSLSYEEVTEIFVRVNSLGAQLRKSDLALAQITAKWRGALAIFQEFERECAKNGFRVDQGVNLRNLVAFATGQSRFKTVGRLPLTVLQQSWKSCRRGMEFAISYLKSNLGIESPALLSSPSLLITTAYFGYQREYQITPEESARFRYWALTANAKGRYSRGSSETLLDQDLATLRDGGDAESLIERLRQQVGRLDVVPAELVGRNQRSSLFKTMFLAFQASGAKDWRSDLGIALDHSGTQDRLQFHHIFPKALLSAAGRSTREADDIANLAFISGSTNLKISDTAPARYLAALRDSGRIEALRAQSVPTEDDLFDIANYDQFLTRRRELIADRLNLFLGAAAEDGLDLPRDPYLAELDRKVARVELGLRALIEDRLGGDRSMVPSHIADKVRQRLEDASRKDPTAVRPNDATLGQWLHCCDLRELQDIVTAKALWDRFASAFGAKDLLVTRCAQLAELRNTLRHSRPLGEVTRRDGEAALAWFDPVIKGAVGGLTHRDGE